MESLPDFSVMLPLLVFLIAVLYSSVGHGGASGYLAALSLLAIAPSLMSTTALTLNVLVAGTAWYSFYRAGHFRWRITWPFLATSIPAAFLGALLRVSDHVYFLLLAIVLAGAAFRLALSAVTPPVENTEPEAISPRISLPTGGVIGVLSGVVGVGGGIFLSPVMILMKWADAKKTSATAAAFVMINSIAGLAGRALKGTLDYGEISYLPLVAFAGGLLGAYIGSTRLSGLTLRRVLAGVLALASLKLFMIHLA